MNVPLSVSNLEPNNVWMAKEDVYDVDRACRQWLQLYRRISQDALVYTLPGHGYLQDLPFVANLGCYLPHCDTMLLSRFCSLPRIGEEKVGRIFFEQCGYNVEQPPLNYHWEGEADLKHIGPATYVGGIGQRSTPLAYRWMRDNFDIDVVEITLSDPKLYHLDCVFLPLGGCRALVNTAALSRQDVAKLGKYVDIIPVPEQHKYDGWTNAFWLDNALLSGCVETCLQFSSYMENKAAGLHLEFFDLTEFGKSGADLSCLIMRLNYVGSNDGRRRSNGGARRHT